VNARARAIGAAPVVALVAVVALGAYAALLAATAPAWPDDWDGVGFVASVRDFDLARFHPHPPGYPVYVALLRVAAVVAGEPMRACVLVAVASGAAAVAFAFDAVKRFAGERSAWLVAAALAAAPLAWRTCSGVGSEAPALACAAACVWGLSRGERGAVALGVGAGLGLGVRLSWAPLFVALLALAPRGARARAWGWATGAGAAWAVPFVAIVGASRLASLYAAHFAGHAERWGGTIVTDPGPERIVLLARDVFVDGLGAGGDALGIAIAALTAACVVQAAMAWRRARWVGWRRVVVAVVPYVAWIALGQNLRQQPRHALPVVAFVAGALALGARSRRALALLAPLVLLVALRTALDAHARRTVPPAGAQLVALVRAQPDPSRLAVYANASYRFFEGTDAAPRAHLAGSLGDVELSLANLDSLPTRAWVTSELVGIDRSQWALDRVATLCRPARIDRRMPCLDVYSWRLPWLARP
jgi:hypothetical protein